MITVVSDLHMGHEDFDKKKFKEFLNDKVKQELGPEDHFVLLGDIFDFWRDKDSEAIEDNRDVMKDLMDLKTRVHYLYGNHDFYISILKNRLEQYCSFDIQKSLRLESGGKKFFFIHGYELEVWSHYQSVRIENYEKICESLTGSGNITGKIMSKTWDLIEMLKPPDKRKGVDKVKDMAMSDVRCILYGMRNDEALVFAHTHREFADEKTRTYNAGSWLKSKYSANGTYIDIDKGEVSIENWPK